MEAAHFFKITSFIKYGNTSGCVFLCVHMMALLTGEKDVFIYRLTPD